MKEIVAAGGKAAASYDSVSDFAAAKNIIDIAVKNFGRLDILVNNAGILRDRMIVNMTEAEWDAVIATHLKRARGTARGTRPASCASRKSGRIISFTSTSGLYCNSGQANYGAAKAGIAGMTRVVARKASSASTASPSTRSHRSRRRA